MRSNLLWKDEYKQKGLEHEMRNILMGPKKNKTLQKQLRRDWKKLMS